MSHGAPGTELHVLVFRVLGVPVATERRANTARLPLTNRPAVAWQVDPPLSYLLAVTSVAFCRLRSDAVLSGRLLPAAVTCRSVRKC